MSAEGYRIRRLDNNTELISTPLDSKVEPFPTRSWNEPLPIAVQGRPLPKSETEKSETKSLTRFLSASFSSLAQLSLRSFSFST